MQMHRDKSERETVVAMPITGKDWKQRGVHPVARGTNYRHSCNEYLVAVKNKVSQTRHIG
jgi:hypothetical protein